MKIHVYVLGSFWVSYQQMFFLLRDPDWLYFRQMAKQDPTHIVWYPLLMIPDNQHFDWDLTHQVLFLYIFPSHHMNLRDQHDWKMLIHWCRTDICSCKISAKISLMLDNPFLVPSFCKLNHICLCFIQISKKSAYSPSGKAMFFEVISGVLGHSVNFNIT